jgi:hypothetical protein
LATSSVALISPGCSNPIVVIRALLGGTILRFPGPDFPRQRRAAAFVSTLTQLLALRLGGGRAIVSV